MKKFSTQKSPDIGTLGKLLIGLTLCCLTTSSHATSVADSAFNAYNTTFLYRSGSTAYYKTSVNSSGRAGSWEAGLDIQLAEDAFDRTGSAANKQLVSDLCTSFLAYENYDWALDTWNDDIAWMALACIRGYRITGNTAFLNKGISAWNMAYNRGWDSTFGGGIWEDMNQKTTSLGAKCALSNDPMIVAGCMLRQITGDATYQTKCVAIYDWVRSHLFNTSNGQVNEGIGNNGTSSGHLLSSDNVYNSGAFINAANALHNLTGNAMYYNDALLAADHVVNNNPILSNGNRGGCWEDQFARGLANFCQDKNLWGRYQTWFTAQANAAWNKRRTDKNITWNSWTTQTPSDDCGSLECLSAAVIQQVVPTFGSQPLANGTYKVINRNSGKSLEVASYGTANNSNIQQWGYVGIPSQKWTLTYLGNSQYKIIGLGSGAAVDVDSSSTADGANVHLWDFVGGDNQKWTITATSGGYYSVKAVHSGKALDVAGVSTADGANVYQWTYVSGNNQQWSFQAP